MDRADVIKEIADRVLAAVPAPGPATVGPDDDLLTISGFDSLGILETLVWVETRFEIAIPDEDLDVSRFATVAQMADYVLRKTAITA